MRLFLIILVYLGQQFYVYRVIHYDNVALQKKLNYNYFRSDTDIQDLDEESSLTQKKFKVSLFLEAGGSNVTDLM